MINNLHCWIKKYLILLCSFMTFTVVYAQQNNPSILLKIRIVDIGKNKLKLSVDIENKSDQSIKIVSIDHLYGASGLTFYFLDHNGAKVIIYHRPTNVQTSSKNIPVLNISSNEIKSLYIDLLDGTWVWPTALGSGNYNTLIAELNMPQGEDGSASIQYWSGHLESPAIQIPLKIYEILLYEGYFWRKIDWNDIISQDY